MSYSLFVLDVEKVLWKMILVCSSDSEINGLTDYQWPQNMIVNGLILIYFPMPLFSSREQLCLKQDQALSWVLDFCPPCFQMWKWGFILSCCLSDAHKRAWIRLDEWRWRKDIHHTALNISHDNKQPCRWYCACIQTLKMQKWQLCLQHSK